jgi:DNA-binding transcriptional LysR family regulator
VTLTPLGARLRERLHHVFTELEQVLGELDLSREVTGIVTLAASTTLARYFVPRIFLRFHQYHPAAALNLIMGNTEQRARSRFYARSRRTGSSSRTPSGTRLAEGHQHSPGVRLEEFLPDEIVPVCATRIPDPRLRRAIEGLKSVRNLEALPLISREPGAGTRRVIPG